MSNISRQTKYLEHFSKGGNGVTNFDVGQIHIYCFAIEEYGNPGLYVGEPIPGQYETTGMKALRVRSDDLDDLSDFWEVFRKVKERMEK